MKKVRKVLIAVLSVMLLVCMGLFAACDNGDDNADSGSGSGSEQKVYYTVTVAEYNTAQGSVTLDPAPADGKYEKDASVSVTVTPNADYEVDSVKANGTALTANGSGKYVFTVTADTTVAVTFKAKTTPPADEKVNLTLTCGENGTATLDPAPVDGKVAKGASVTLTVTPAANYEVDSVKVNGTALTANSDGKYTFTADADTTVSVTFKAKTTQPADEKVSLTLTCGENGTATLDPAPVDGKVAKGVSVTVTVTPNADYEVDSVKVNGSAVTANSDGKYTFTADADTTVEVTFKAKALPPAPGSVYTVTYALGDHAAAGVTVPAAAEANEGNGYKVTLPAALDAAVGYRFVGWKVGAETKDAASEISVSENLTVIAVWEEKHNNQYTNVPVGTWGQVLPRNYTLQKGDAVILSGSFSGKAADDVYQGIVTQVFAGGTVTDGNYYFFRPDCPVQVINNEWKFWGDSGCTWATTPEWVADSYKAETEGSVVVTVALSDAGVLTVEVAFTGTSYSYTNLYTVSAPMESALVFFAADGCTPAKASVRHYTASDPVKYVALSLTCGDNGTAVLDPAPVAGEIVKGTTVKLTLSPAENYEVASIKVNNTAVSFSGNEYTLTVNSDTTIDVTFKLQMVTLKLNVGRNGSAVLDPAPADGKIAKGTSVKLTMTANENYEVDTVKVNGTAVEFTGTEYTFTVTGYTTVEVTFKAQLVSVDVTCGENGKYTLDPAPVDGKVEKGSSVKLTLKPAVNYEVDTVKVNNAPVELTDNTYTFTASADTTVDITFKIKMLSLTATYEAAQGSVTFENEPVDGKIASGTQISLTIEPAYGYEIVSVTVNQTDVTAQLEELLLVPGNPALSNMRDHSAKRNLTLGTITADMAIAVTFRQATHKITFKVEGPGTCTLYDSTVSLAEQTELTSLTAVPAATKVHAVLECESYVTPEFHVVDDTRDLKMNITSGNTYFWVVDRDLTVTVTFTVDRTKAPQHSVTVTGGENGTYEITPKTGYLLEDNVFYGDGEATVKLTPNVTDTETYLIDALKIKYGEGEETDVTADLDNGSYTFPVTGDVELVVSFKKFESAKLTTTYTGTWRCDVKGESTTVSLTIQVTSSSILIKENGVTTLSGKPYTATFGYTVYVENSDTEDVYTIYILPDLNNRVLALTLNGDSSTYYVKSTVSDRNVTIDEAIMGTEGSSWYGGAASMPIVFEFGKAKIDSVEATLLAQSETDGVLVYTVYANGGLYQLIYTRADDSLVLHPYGKSTENDVPYERETPPDPVLVPQFAGFYSNNEHYVDIDVDGNFSFDGTARNLYYDDQTRVYTFRTSEREYTVRLLYSSVSVYNTAANQDWTLRKIEEGTAQYTLTVNCPSGTVAYSVKNAEMKYYAGSSVTISITPNKHFEVQQVTVNGTDKTFTNDAGVIKVTVTINEDTTVEVIFNEFKEENLLSDLYQGVYTDGSTTVTITATEVTVKNTGWSLNVKFTDAQITNTGVGQFTLVNGNRKFTFTFSNENTQLKVGDPNWAMGGSPKTLKKQES